MIDQVFKYKYPRAALTVDAVIFAEEDGVWYVLAIERGKEPFKGSWALPGGFFDLDDASTEIAARRELYEETGFDAPISMTLVGVFSDPDRDPRERVISMAYTAKLDRRHAVKGADDAAKAEWRRVDEMARPDLWAFDHYAILVRALAVHDFGKNFQRSVNRALNVPDDLMGT